jgi:hypothetical protein
LGNVTSKYQEEHNKLNNFNNSNSYNENENWFNSLVCVEPVLEIDGQMIILKYKENYKFIQNSYELNLKPPILFKSAYSEILSSILNFMKNPNGKLLNYIYL